MCVLRVFLKKLKLITIIEPTMFAAKRNKLNNLYVIRLKINKKQYASKTKRACRIMYQEIVGTLI